MNRSFYLLWYGQFVSIIGSQAFTVALMCWIKHVTSSAAIMGFLMMASMIPGVILGPIGGVFADRHSRRTIIVLCDIINGIAVLTLSILMFLIPNETRILLFSLFIVAIILGASRSFFSPAIAAAIPDLVPKDKINRANSFNQSSSEIAIFIGQGLGGLLYRTFGGPVLFFIDAATYLVAATCESFVSIPQASIKNPVEAREIYTQVINDLKEGISYVQNKGGLKTLFIVFALINFFSMPFILFIPFYVEDILKTTPDWYGYLLSAFGFGTLIGFMAAGLLNLPKKHKSKLFIILLFNISIALASLGFITTAYLSLIDVFITGIMFGAINLSILTVLQISTPTNIRGRIFGLMGTVTGALSPIAMGLGGIAGDLTNNNIPLIYSVCGGGLFLVSIIALVNNDFLDFISYDRHSNLQIDEGISPEMNKM